MTATETRPLRHELKFVAPAERYHELENWVRVHAGGFERAFPPRRVNNVYFDTPDLAAYLENLSGTSHRTKMRLRWYGETHCPDLAALELKFRRNHLGGKTLYRVAGLDFDHHGWAELKRKIRNQLPPEGKLVFDASPQPVMINRYDRQYYERPERDVRITLDRHQVVFDQRQKNRPNLVRRANLPDSLVVEVKFAPADREIGERIIQAIPIRVSRNSKYAIAVQSILG